MRWNGPLTGVLDPGRWFDDSQGGSAGGPRLDKCRAFTEEELASQEIREGGWFNQVAFEVMQVGCAPLIAALQCAGEPSWHMHRFCSLTHCLATIYVH